MIREGKEREIPASQLVVGDIVCLDAGCQVPRGSTPDQNKQPEGGGIGAYRGVPAYRKGRSLHRQGCSRLRTQLTVRENVRSGGSGFRPDELQGKREAKVQKEMHIPLGDRYNMAYMSTIVTYGRGEGIVTATGMDTEIGKIASLINESHEDITPLQKRLGELGKILSLLSLLLCAALFLIALIQKRNMIETLITAISLAVGGGAGGASRGGAPSAWALSVTKMVKVHTIAIKLPSVETLGAVSVVCSDKTGTLTQNKMTVETCFTNQKMVGKKELAREEYREFLKGMTLCNDAVLEGGERIGDPTASWRFWICPRATACTGRPWKRNIREPGELAFDSTRKMMSTFHQRGNQTVTYTKGALG